MRQPLERRPTVRRVPLLARRDQRRDEPAGREELALEARGDGAPLLRRRQPEVQRRGRRQRGAIASRAHRCAIARRRRTRSPNRTRRRAARAGALPPRREYRAATAASPAPPRNAPQRRDRSLGVIQQAVEIDRHELGRLERAQVRRIAHPAAREIPPALRRGAHIPIERGSREPRGALRRARSPPGTTPASARPIVPVAVQQRALAQSNDAPRRRAGASAVRARPSRTRARARARRGTERARGVGRAARRGRPSPRRTAAGCGSGNTCGCRSGCGPRCGRDRAKLSSICFTRSARPLSTRPSIVKYESQ